jgi:hypothetical protein
MFDLARFIRDFFKMPMPAYQSEWIKVYTDMAVHTRKVIPTETLLSRRPNESEEVKCYRISQYRPITYGSMNRAMDELYRIVSSINFVLNCNDGTKNLMNENIFGGFSFNLFLQQVVLRRMIEDPNGLLVWLPGGNGVSDNSEKVTPVPYLVCSQDIHYMDQDVLSFLSHEKSPVIENKQTVYDGKVFYILTKTEFYKLIQYGKKSDNTFKAELFYEHGIGEVPRIILGGDYIKPEGEYSHHGYFDSFFSPYLAFGNEAICQFSDWQAVMVTSSHPIREEFATECELIPVSEQARSQRIPPEGEVNQDEEYKPSKYILKPMSKSPYGTILRRPKKAQEGVFDEAVLAPEIPSVRFIHPDINIAKYCGESWEKLIAMAEDALHLNLGQGLLSGEAKKVDRKAQESMLLKIGNNFFDNIYYSSVVYIDAYYRYVAADRKGITIDKPANYDLKTEQDIVEEISTLKEKHAPDFFVANSAMDLANKRFSGDRVMRKVFDIIQVRDPLFTYTIDEKSKVALGGAVPKTLYTDSVMIYSILTQISKDMTAAAFLQTDNNKIIEEFNKRVAVYYAAPPMPLVGPNGEEDKDTEDLNA